MSPEIVLIFGTYVMISCLATIIHQENEVKNEKNRRIITPIRHP